MCGLRNQQQQDDHHRTAGATNAAAAQLQGSTAFNHDKLAELRDKVKQVLAGKDLSTVNNAIVVNVTIAAASIGVSLFGGQGRIVGVVAGSVLLVIISNGVIVLNVSPYYRQIVLGGDLDLGIAITGDRVRAKRLGGLGAPRRTPIWRRRTFDAAEPKMAH